MSPTLKSDLFGSVMGGGHLSLAVWGYNTVTHISKFGNSNLINVCMKALHPNIK